MSHAHKHSGVTAGQTQDIYTVYYSEQVVILSLSLSLSLALSLSHSLSFSLSHSLSLSRSHSVPN